MSEAARRSDIGAHLPMLHRESLAISVAKILKRYIVAQRLEPGARLPPERQLAESLNVSRTVLREALGQLIGEGIVQRPTHRALRVAEFDRSRLASELASLNGDDPELRDLIELRAIIELGAIEAVVHRANDEDLHEIEHWVEEGERRVASGESIAWVDAHFHAALLHALDNRSVDAFLPLIEETLRRNILAYPRQLTSTGGPDDHRVLSEHRQIFEALKRRDSHGARLIMRAHLGAYLRREWEATGVGREIEASVEPPAAVEERT